MPAYYNENDSEAAAWLRELIKEGLIPDGEVDERDIREVPPADLRGFGQLHFFAGIGGWAHALRLAGWPEDRPVVTGSCPCQPFSNAGKRKGTKDERHLWPAFRWLIAQLRPPVVFGEQVESKDGCEWLSGVRDDLEAIGYRVGASDLPAAGVGSPHIRQRLWWVAYSEAAERRGIHGGTEAGGRGRAISQAGGCGLAGGLAYSGCSIVRDERQSMSGATGGDQGEEDQRERIRDDAGDVCDSGGLPDAGSERGSCDERRPGTGEEPFVAGSVFWGDFDILPFRDEKFRRVEPGTFPLAHGIPGRVGLLRGYGNAIVPQVAAEFIGAFLDLNNKD